MASRFSTWGSIAGCALGLVIAGDLTPCRALAQAPAGADCRALAEAMEREAGLPPGLLVAIGQVETGRPDAATGRVEPWPWSANLNGAGHFFTTAAEAVAWTAAQWQAGQRSIDVGCFQINLKYHPDAFATLEEAFDPANNARYAANFLNSLYRRTNSWQLAAAQYHSADPEQGEPYGSRVFALMGGGLPPNLAATAAVGLRTDRMAIRLPLFAGIRVIVPAWAEANSGPARAPALLRQTGAGVPPVAIRLVAATSFGRRLPRVYTPS